MERIVIASSNEGDIVMGSFCGSATMGVAALRHGRKFVGIDLGKEYLDEYAIPRLNDELARKDQPKLIVCEGSGTYGMLP